MFVYQECASLAYRVETFSYPLLHERAPSLCRVDAICINYLCSILQEYHAATRVQKVFRRYLVQKEMEHSGLTTSYIRNRRRQRKAKAANFPTSMEETAPDLGFGCCSMSLALCDEGFDASDNIAYNDFQRMQYEEKIRSQKEREDFLSQSYLEQKGIPSKAVELDQTKFQDQMLLDL